MKIAFVYDKITKFGGAERILQNLHTIWPDAPIYTSLYDRKNAAWAENIRIIPGFLQIIPFLRSKPEFLYRLMPLSFEQFDFRDYDVVISVTAADGKAVITRPSTLHLCYCLTPVRYLWSGYFEYLREPGFGICNGLARILMRTTFSGLRREDYILAKRPDSYLSISGTVARRIRKYYSSGSEIIYPPVDTETFVPASPAARARNGYFLIVSRLVPYKRIDYAIHAFKNKPYRLVIVGEGLDKKRLSSESASNVTFVSNLTDRELCCYYQGCSALIFPGEEDFGLTALEAQACGKPVIAYNGGGMRECVRAGETGIFFDHQNAVSLMEAISRFSSMKFSPEKCRLNAERFSSGKFRRNMRESVYRHLELYRKSM